MTVFNSTHPPSHYTCPLKEHHHTQRPYTSVHVRQTALYYTYGSGGGLTWELCTAAQSFASKEKRREEKRREETREQQQ